MTGMDMYVRWLSVTSQRANLLLRLPTFEMLGDEKKPHNQKVGLVLLLVVLIVYYL